MRHHQELRLGRVPGDGAHEVSRQEDLAPHVAARARGRGVLHRAGHLREGAIAQRSEVHQSAEVPRLSARGSGRRGWGRGRERGFDKQAAFSRRAEVWGGGGGYKCNDMGLEGR